MEFFRRGCTDKPVASVTEDCFNVKTYVEGLSSFILTCETPMTISIQGDWGSGKTSMMNMIKENMESKVVPIWFNTWQFSQFDLGNNLVFSMLEVLMDKLDAKDVSLDKIKSTGVAGVKKLMVAIADSATNGTVAEIVANALGGAEQNYADDIIKLKMKFQTAVNEKIKKDKKERVVVFVDDLDRLQPSKAVELLEVLKLFLDCENCVFILAVDYEVVTLGIKQKFGDDVSEEKGKSFFDKIIQLPFKMPVAQYDIKNYVKRTLEKMSFDNNDQIVDVYVELIKTSIGFNPRSMKRMFNTFQLLDIISKNTIRGIDEAIRQKILFATICMQMQYEGLYKYFVTSPNALENEEMSLFLEEDAFSKIMEDMDFAISITDAAEDIEGELKRIVAFMKKFIQAIQLDEEEEISEIERNTLRCILKCSMVTSVNNAQEEQEDDMERQYRWKNRQLGKKICDLLKNDFGEFRTWLPRKSRPESGIKLSDACYYQIYDAQLGLRFSLEFYISRLDSETVSVCMQLRDKSSQRDVFFNTFGDSPLDCYSMKGRILEWGGIDYPDVLKLKYNDSNNTEIIAAEWRKAYQSAEKYFR